MLKSKNINRCWRPGKYLNLVPFQKLNLGVHKKAYRELLSIGIKKTLKKHYENTILFREPFGYPLFKIKIIHCLNS